MRLRKQPPQAGAYERYLRGRIRSMELTIVELREQWRGPKRIYGPKRARRRMLITDIMDEAAAEAYLSQCNNVPERAP